jgi:hypothetical protein
LALIQQDQKEASLLFEQIEVRRRGKKLSERCVEDIKRSLVLSRTLQTAVHDRITENLERIKKFKEAEKTLRLDESSVETEERPTATEFLTLFDFYQQEISRYTSIVESDRGEAQSATTRTRNLEQQLLEARSRLTQESKSLGFLEACRRQILSTISEKQALISHGRLLPDEILVAIFQNEINRAINNLRKKPQISRTFMVLRLSWVCRRWRNLIYYTPSLWECVPLATPLSVTSYSSKLAATSHYLSRCESTRSLIIQWPDKGPWTIATSDRYDIWAQPLGVETCTDPLSHCLTNAPEDIKVALRNARSLELVGRDQNTKVDCQIAANCYIIRQLYPVFNSKIATGVTELRLHTEEMTNSRLCSILAPLTGLYVLELDIPNGCSRDPTSLSAPIILPKLHTLVASIKVHIQVLGIVFSAPGLCQLSVKGEGGEPQSLSNWKACIDRKALNDSITHLTLSRSSSEEQTRVHLLPKFAGWTGVEHLVLQGAHHTPIVKVMAADQTRFSKLTELTLLKTDIPGEILEKLVMSRTNQENATENGTKRLQKLTLNGCKRINRRLCEGLMTMVDKLIVC